MRALTVIAGLLVMFLVGGWVDHNYDWPWGLLDPYAGPSAAPAAAMVPGNTYVPSYSKAQGLQDAPRADTPQGGATDYQRCVNTMVLRKESEAEAKQVCAKIIKGIGG